MPYLLLPLLLLLTMPAHAVIQQFGANEHNSVWLSEGDNKFRCSLKQTIPNFGEATFRRIAGGKLNLKVDLIHPNRAEREVELIARPPLWRHQQKSRLLDSFQLNEPTTQVKFKAQQARVALTELEQGLFPTIRYYVKEDGNREVNAALSSVNFQPHYNQFITCLSQLMPYQFEYVKESKFYFRTGSSTLSAIDKRRLNEIIRYVKADPSIKWAHIKGYTDSKGFRNINDKLGERRAKTIQNYLASHGIGSGDIDLNIKSYGERMPIQSNRTAKGRTRNRVALFTLFNKEPPPPTPIPDFEFDNIFDNLPGQEPKYQAPKPKVSKLVTPITKTAVDKPAPQASAPATPTSPTPSAPPLVAPDAAKAPAATKTEPPPPPSAAPSLFAPITADMVETGK